VLFSAQFDAGKGLRTFLEKLLRAPSYGAVGVAHKSAIERFGRANAAFLGRFYRNVTLASKAKGSGMVGKAIVMGVLERCGEVRTSVVANTKRVTLAPEVREHDEPGSAVFTDALKS